MDDLLGTLLDIDESVRHIKNWIEGNGGFEKNALYVTADHDHYLTLLPHFPEALALLLIDGTSHNITPENNSEQNPWVLAIQAGRHEQVDKGIVQHIRDFSTWTEDDINNVGHFGVLWEVGATVGAPILLARFRYIMKETTAA